MKMFEQGTRESVERANRRRWGEKDGKEMCETIVLSSRVKMLVCSAKKNGGRDCETEKACEQRGPDHMEAQSPNQEGRENEQVGKEPVCEDSHVGKLFAKRFPSFTDGFGVESFASHFFQSGFTFWRWEFG